MRIAVIGGGVIGLASAWYLARAGADVIVLDARDPGHGASWAAAGMLAAHVEHESDDSRFLAFARASQARWPGFAAALQSATGLDVGLRNDGTLVAVFDEAEERVWRGALLRRRTDGSDLEWLDRAAVRRLVPAIAPDVSGGVFSPRDGKVDNRALVRALLDAVQASGVALRSHCRVLGIEPRGGRVRAVLTNRDRIEVDGAVLAAGAWSGDLAGLPADLALPVRPIKGQMAALHWDASRVPAPGPVLWAAGIYGVAREGGTFVVGATSEDVGFDGTLTAGGLAGLLNGAARALPAASGFAMSEAWTGFRPTAPDGLPIIGKTALEGLTVATGHHRNGILLAPVTAELVADLTLGRAPRLDIGAFRPGRFRSPAQQPARTAGGPRP